MTATALSAAAFGDDPGMWPLPAAHTPAELWLRAVAAGGQGHYGSAQADLSALLRQVPAGGLASLALSTRASFLRQLGGHRAARGWDGRALALAGTDGASTVEPAVDALVGLAADALGVGRLAASATLLERADAELARADVPPARLAIRRAWVGAELAMAAGDGARAQASAERGVELAERALPALRRHRVKSDVVLAAALCSAGAIDRAREVADRALTDTAVYGLVPLRWALACLLSDLGSTTRATHEVVTIREQCAAEVTRRGGRWSGG